MRKRLFSVLAFVAPFAALVGGSRPALGYCRLTTCQPVEDCPKDEAGCPAVGAALRWGQTPIPWRLHSRGYAKIKVTALQKAIRAAFERWTTVECKGKPTSLAFEELPDAPPNEPDAMYAVSMVNEGWPFDDTALAQTTHDFGKDTGTVKNAVIQVNTAEHDFVVASDSSATALSADPNAGADIESVLVHEVGHYIGLAHSDAPGSIMAPSYCQDKNRCQRGAEASRSLGKDDIEALCALYPPAGAGPDVGEDPAPAPSTSFGCTIHASSGGSSAGTVTLALAISAGLRRSSRRGARR